MRQAGLEILPGGGAEVIWLSLDKDRSLFNGDIHWSRMFRTVRSD